VSRPATAGMPPARDGWRCARQAAAR
jgi:hypothetical protein